MKHNKSKTEALVWVLVVTRKAGTCRVRDARLAADDTTTLAYGWRSLDQPRSLLVIVFTIFTRCFVFSTRLTVETAI